MLQAKAGRRRRCLPVSRGNLSGETGGSRWVSDNLPRSSSINYYQRAPFLEKKEFGIRNRERYGRLRRRRSGQKDKKERKKEKKTTEGCTTIGDLVGFWYMDLVQPNVSYLIQANTVHSHRGIQRAEMRSCWPRWKQ